jgi:hypothetical protein
MKTQVRISLLSLFAVFSLMMAAFPASAGVLLFSNGSPAGNIYGWEIDNGYVVSDSFSFSGTANSVVVGLWVLPGQKPQSLEWSVTSSENALCPSNECLSSGTYIFQPADLTPWSGGLAYGYIGGGNGTTATNCTAGCPLYLATINFPGGLSVPGGTTVWLNLENATATGGGPVGWDENDGPNSFASQNTLGTIGSEDPDFYGTPNGATPEPSSMVLSLSGALGLLSGSLRRRFFG